ncbi:MAG: hypothetical protein J5614_04285, partial [Paludibacteraceae bacterium]|nr:hypothetical protein [Paludibacteraceae bacterium]
KLLSAFLTMFAMVVFSTSCGDDDNDDDNKSEELSGAWITTESNEESNETWNLYVYFADGFMYTAEESSDGKEWLATRCKYVFENGILRNAKDQSGCSAKIIDNRKLKLWESDYEMIFEKCNMPATFNRIINAGEYEELERGLF